MTQVSDTTRNHLHHVVEALDDDFDGVSKRQIEKTVEQSVDELDPRFEDFVPALADRRSREKLRRAGQSSARTPG